MSKGLEALERIKSHNYNKCSKKECIDTIEKELKRLEKIDEWELAYKVDDEKLLKCAYKGIFFIDYTNYECARKIYEINQALEIIKEKPHDSYVLISTLKSRDITYQEYCRLYICNLTEQEFELLKGIMK